MANNQIEIIRNEPDCIIVRHSSEGFVRLDYFTVFTTYCNAPQMFTFGTLEQALEFVEFHRAEAKKGGAQ